MRNERFIATAWPNGPVHGPDTTFGLKIPYDDRARFFDEGWKTVTLISDGNVFAKVVNIDKDSFWNNKDCGELISENISEWLRGRRHAPCPVRRPPKFRLTPTRAGEFDVTRIP